MVNSESLAEVFQLNIAGINPKVHKQKVKLKTLGELVRTKEKKPPFFVLIESHLKPYILDAEVSIPEYNLLQADRASRRNGGVIIYYHHSFSVCDTETFSNSYCEAAMAYNQENNFIIVAVYKPPDASAKSFKECLEKIKSFKDKYEDANIIIFGDMNLKFIDWRTETLKRPANITQPI